MGITAHTPIASSGSFLITPNVGLMIWVLVVFLIVAALLTKFVFPAIGKVLDDRATSINGEIDTATQLRAHKTAEAHHKQVVEETNAEREHKLEQIRKDIDAETKRAIESIRSEVAALTVLATEKVTRTTLTEDDHKRLIDDALSELDFSALAGGKR
jgi:F-type H+-transporting ATPase subunit b